MREARIGLDGRALSNVSSTRGIGRYTACLVEALARRGGRRYVLFGYGREPSPELLEPAGMERLEWREVPRLAGPPQLTLPGDHLLFARAVDAARVDLFHAIDHNMTPFLSSPSVVTVHDLIPLVLRGPYLGPTSRLWSAAHRRAARRARAVVAVSENTARDVERLWSIPAGRIQVIYEGVSGIFRPVNDREARETVLRKHGISSPYFLYCGGFDPRKNIRNMLLAFKRLLLARGTGHSLVMCGDTTGFDAYLREELEELGLQRNVKLTGFVAENDLPALYSGAAAFLCVSLYEGFGLPLLEAMACGCPVLAARAASIPEVVGDAGLLVDPLDPSAIMKGMERIACDREYAEELAARGLSRSRLFTWERAAEAVGALHERILGVSGDD